MRPAVTHVGLTVSSLDRSLAFYRDAVGLEVVLAQEKEGGYLSAITRYPGAHVRMAQLEGHGGSRIELFEYLEPRGRVASHEPADVGITHVCVLVDAGAEPFSDPVPIDTGANSGGWGLYVRDPDGIVLELFQPPAG